MTGEINMGWESKVVMTDMSPIKKVKKTEKITRERDEKEEVADVCPDVVLRVYTYRCVYAF